MASKEALLNETRLFLAFLEEGESQSLLQRKERFEGAERKFIQDLDKSILFEQEELAERTEHLVAALSLANKAIWLGFGVLFALTILAGANLSRTVVQRIQKLKSATDQFSWDNRDVRADETGNDELSDLAAGFNRMMRRVHEEHSQREQAEQTAIDANKSKSVFFASMTHELRTPLNAIIGYSDMIQNKIFGPIQPATYLEYVNDINNSGNYLLSLVNEVLDMAKIESGEFTVFLEKTNVPSIVIDIKVMLRGLAEQAEVSLYTDFPSDLPLGVADKRTTKQLLINLMTNAIKFTPKGGEVTVRVSASQDKLAVSVSDTGAGMSPENVTRALEPFVQVGGEERQQQGTGLGLPLCKKFAEIQGGHFFLESEPEKGTTATFTLHLAEVEDVQVDASSPNVGAINRLTWLPSMSVGIEGWDNDHKELFMIIAAFQDAVDRDVPPQDIVPLCQKLRQSMEIHLSSEESVMASLAYPKYEEHSAAHDTFREWLGQLIEQLEQSSGDWDGRDAADFTVSWWYNHVLLVDSLYMEFFENIKGDVVAKLARYKGVKGTKPEETACWPSRKPGLYETADENPPAKKTRSTQYQASRPLHILVAEDNPFNQKIISANLKSIGHTFEIAENGAVAVETYKNGSFDFILMDVRMPEMNGLEATRVIRQMGGKKGAIPIVALTADATEDHIDEYLKAGMNDAAAKPINIDHLMEAINEAMGERIHQRIETVDAPAP